MYSMKEAKPTGIRLSTASVLLPWLCAMTHIVRASAEDEDGKGFLGRANDMFDSVWYPLPAWVRILLVIAAWVMCYRLATNVTNVTNKKK